MVSIELHFIDYNNVVFGNHPLNDLHHKQLPQALEVLDEHKTKWFY